MTGGHDDDQLRRWVRESFVALALDHLGDDPLGVLHGVPAPPPAPAPPPLPLSRQMRRAAARQAAKDARRTRA